MRLFLIILGIGIAAFCSWTAIQAFRSPIRHPWWWAFVSVLCGPVTTICVEGCTLSTKLLAVIVLGVAYGHSVPDGHTVIQLGFPAGALLFRSRRRQLLAAARPMLAEDQLPP